MFILSGLCLVVGVALVVHAVRRVVDLFITDPPPILFLVAWVPVVGVLAIEFAAGLVLLGLALLWFVEALEFVAGLFLLWCGARLVGSEV